MEFAIHDAYEVGQKPVTRELVETALKHDFDDLEPRLVRQGDNAKVIASLLNVGPAQVRSFLNGQLAPGRTEEIREQMLKVGIPLF